LLAQHVSGTTMPIIRNSRVLYSGCCLWYFLLWFSSYWSGVELRVMFFSSCWLHLVGILFPHITDDARSKSHQICMCQTGKNNSPIQEPQTEIIQHLFGILFPHINDDSGSKSHQICRCQTGKNNWRIQEPQTEIMQHLVGILFPHIKDDARSKPHQISMCQTGKKHSRIQEPQTEIIQHLVGILFPHINEDERSTSHQTSIYVSRDNNANAPSLRYMYIVLFTLGLFLFLLPSKFTQMISTFVPDIISSKVSWDTLLSQDFLWLTSVSPGKLRNDNSH